MDSTINTDGLPKPALVLPIEIQIQILKHLVPTGLTVHVKEHPGGPSDIVTKLRIYGYRNVDSDRAVMKAKLHTTCQILSREWLKMMYCTTTFVFDKLQAANYFSESIGPENSKSVKKIRVDNYKLHLDIDCEDWLPYPLSRIYPDPDSIVLDFQEIGMRPSRDPLPWFMRGDDNGLDLLKLIVRNSQNFNFYGIHYHWETLKISRKGTEEDVLLSQNGEYYRMINFRDCFLGMNVICDGDEYAYAYD